MAAAQGRLRACGSPCRETGVETAISDWWWPSGLAVSPGDSAVNTVGTGSASSLPPAGVPWARAALPAGCVCNEAQPQFLGKSYFLRGSGPSPHGDLQYRLAKLAVFWTHRESLLEYTFPGPTLSVSGARLELPQPRFQRLLPAFRCRKTLVLFVETVGSGPCHPHPASAVPVLRSRRCGAGGPGSSSGPNS